MQLLSQTSRPIKAVFSWIRPGTLESSTTPQDGEPKRRELVPEGRVRDQQSALHACMVENAPTQTEESSAGGPMLGYKADLAADYDMGREIGRGAHGIVHIVVHKETRREYACKSVLKVPSPDTPPEKVQEHLDALKREVAVARKLVSCLNVAKLEDVYEDAAYVHIITEWCQGGEIDHSVGTRHYSERTAASYMRGVLRTLAQCHANNILHRDVKPGNFLLLTGAPDAPVKAIDFGLAVPYDSPADLPLRDLTMEGTPWFLAPETLSSKWSPASDVWAAGVMAHQLLTGRLPFDDRRNPHNPVLTSVLRSILTDSLNFSRSYWEDISPEAKDFVERALDRDATKRLSARELLKHPWLAGDVSDRELGQPLSLNVVQRIQRWGRSSQLKRSILEMIVSELSAEPRTSGSGSAQCVLDTKARAVMDSPHSEALLKVLAYFKLHNRYSADRDTILEGLHRMGYRLEGAEVDRVIEMISNDPNLLSRDSVIASQMDWAYVQRNHTERWLRLVQAAFRHIDLDNSGSISVDDLVSVLRDRIPAHKVEEMYAAAVAESSSSDGGGDGVRGGVMKFETFMKMLAMSSKDSLDLYDDRLDGTVLSDSAHSGHSGGAALATAAGSGSWSGSGHLAGLPPALAHAGSPSSSSWNNLLACSLQEGSFRGANASLHGAPLSTVFERRA